MSLMIQWRVQNWEEGCLLPLGAFRLTDFAVINCIHISKKKSSSATRFSTTSGVAPKYACRAQFFFQRAYVSLWKFSYVYVGLFCTCVVVLQHLHSRVCGAGTSPSLPILFTSRFIYIISSESAVLKTGSEHPARMRDYGFVKFVRVSFFLSFVLEWRKPYSITGVLLMVMTQLIAEFSTWFTLAISQYIYRHTCRSSQILFFFAQVWVSHSFRVTAHIFVTFLNTYTGIYIGLSKVKRFVLAQIQVSSDESFLRHGPYIGLFSIHRSLCHWRSSF